MILLIDNFDSFAHNLARYLIRLGQEVRIVRNDAIDVAEVGRIQPAAMVLSPGPCRPAQAGCSLNLTRAYWQSIPILGVCLGHQVLVEALGGRIVRARWPMHGRTSEVIHGGEGVLQGIPSPMIACRYHSLVADSSAVPPALRILARTRGGMVMAVQHQSLPLVGLQFHPESILTEYGYAILANFLALAGLAVRGDPPTYASELVLQATPV